VAKARPPSISWLPWWLNSPAGRWLVRSLGLVAVVAGLLAAIIWLSHWAQPQLRDQARYLVPVADIECDSPEAIQRPTFLGEVQYFGQLPDKVSLLDKDLPAQLTRAFGRHPWVEKVDKVALTAPDKIAVRLTFRVPVLAVRSGDELHAVDGSGVRLPKNAPTRGLPVYDGAARPPRGPPGTHWGDSDVEREARKLRADRK
jgi:hypothetical protein